MLMKKFYFCLLTALCAMISFAAFAGEDEGERRWFADAVVRQTLLRHSEFEYYYEPSASEMAKSLKKGEKKYFLTSPQHCSLKQAKEMLDEAFVEAAEMKARGEWKREGTRDSRVFRKERNKVAVTVAHEAMEGGMRYVTVTEIANFYAEADEPEEEATEAAEEKQPKKRSAKRAKQETQPQPDDAVAEETPVVAEEAKEEIQKPVKQKKSPSKKDMSRKPVTITPQEQPTEDLLPAAGGKVGDEIVTISNGSIETQPEAQPNVLYYRRIALDLRERYGFEQLYDEGDGCELVTTAMTDPQQACDAFEQVLAGFDAETVQPFTQNELTDKWESAYSIAGNVLALTIGENADGKISISMAEVTSGK